MPRKKQVDTKKTAVAASGDAAGEQAILADQAEYGDRSQGGPDTHLTPEARALIIELILAHKSNREINAALVRARHLRAGQSLSERTFTTLRKMPETKVDIQRLTEEAIQVGHGALSEALVLAVETMRAGAEALLSPTGAMRGGAKDGEPARLRIAAAMMFKGAEFVWSKLGWQDVVATLAAAEKETLAQIERANMDEDEKAELLLQVKEQQNTLLRGILEKRRAAKQSAQNEASAAIAPPVNAPDAPSSASERGTEP